MLKAGYLVHFETGRPGDPQYGGVITCPNGLTVTMVFDNNVWRLPTMTLMKAAQLNTVHHIQNVTADTAGVSEDNPYSVLLDKAIEVEPFRESLVPDDLEQVKKLDREVVQLIHNRWGHPSCPCRRGSQFLVGIPNVDLGVT